MEFLIYYNWLTSDLNLSSNIFFNKAKQKEKTV